MDCIVIEKNAKTGNIIENFIHQTTALRLLDTFRTVSDATDIFLNHLIDLVFLDTARGIDDVEFIHSVNRHPSQLILISNSERFARKAFDLGVTDYLICPLTWERFLSGVSKALRLHSCNRAGFEAGNMLFLRENSHYARVYHDDILYIKAMGDYVIVHCSGKKYVVKVPMKKMLAKLPPDRFMRTHLSYIVNIDKVMLINDQLVLDNEEMVPYSRAYRKTIIHRLNMI